MAEVKGVWRDAVAVLRERVDRDTYDRYLVGIVPLALDVSAGTVSLGVLNDFTAMWLEANFKSIIAEALYEATQRHLTIHLEPGHTPPPVAAPAASEKAVSVKTASGTRDFRYRPDFTFETFVIGDNSRICAAAAEAVAKNPGKAYNPLFLYGGTGLGKTHLLQAIANEVFRRKKRAKIEYLSSEEFLNLYIEGLQNKTLPSFRRHFRSLDILLIDDIQFFEGKVGSSEEFFHTFNALHNAHKQLVLASDRTPHELSGLEQRLVSRFEWGLSAEILPPDLETRVAILKKKQEKQSIQLPDEILFLIARNIRSNIRNLEGALTKLVMNISAFGYEMSVERATQLLRDRFENEASEMITVERIQRRVAEHFDIRIADMTSKRRPRNIAVPRMVAMYLSRQLTDQSLPAIGDAFGRNHATILHAVGAIERRMDEDADFANAVATLTRQLRA